MQLLPLSCKVAFFCCSLLFFCWAPGRFLDRADGSLQLLMGRDKYSISASTVGDEPES